MTENNPGRRRVGRGLEALLGPTREEAEREGSLVELAIADIRPNPYQPRRDVDAAALEELTASIRKAGLLQPVVVRQAPAGGGGGGGNGGYELIAGERRLRACQALGWEKIPAVKREVDDRTVLTLALVENLQRDDLSPVDEARGYAARARRSACGDVARERGRGAGPVGTRHGRPRARRPGAGAPAAHEEGHGTGARGAAHRGRAASAAGHRRARHPPRQGEGADPPQLLFERRPRAPLGADPRCAVRRMKKKKKDRRVTIVVHTDGEVESRQYRVPLWAFEE